MTKINKIFCLDAEIIEELKILPNASAFVNQMLKDYFMTSKPIKDELEEKRKELQELQEQTKELEVKTKEIEYIEEKNKEEEVKKKEEYENSNERWNKLSAIQLDAFKMYEVPKDKLQELFKEYILMLKDGEVHNIIEYMKLKRINKHEKKQEQ